MKTLSLFLCLFLSACGSSADVVTVALRQAVTSDQVKSYQLWVLRPVDRQGLPLECEQLLTRELVPGAGDVIALREPLEGNFSDAVFDVKAIPADDTEVLFYIDLFDAPGLSGVRIGAGCAAATLAPGKSVEVHLAVKGL